MTVQENRLAVRDKYKIIIGRNKYSQALRNYVNTKYKDGCYYSDCSSSVCWAYLAAGFPISGNSLLNTVGIYQSKKLVDVPVVIKSGKISNPDVLRVGDLLLFAGDDSSRAYAGYVGHVEMVGEISGSTVWLYGHGSGNPKRHEMNAYCKSRYNSKTSKTSKGNKGLIKVRRLLVDDSEVNHLGGRDLRDGCVGNDVREMQAALIALGFNCGPDGADGDYGSNTTKAVKAFQKAAGIDQTGVFDMAVSWPALKKMQGGVYPDPDEPKPAAGTLEVGGAGVKSVNVRCGPSSQYKVLKVALAGERFNRPEIPEGWVCVKFKNAACWVSEKYLSAGAVTGKSVNVRQGPGTGYKSVGILYKGERPTPVNANNWTPVAYGGAVAWISSKYLKEV